MDGIRYTTLFSLAENAAAHRGGVCDAVLDRVVPSGDGRFGATSSGWDPGSSVSGSASAAESLLMAMGGDLMRPIFNG